MNFVRSLLYPIYATSLLGFLAYGNIVGLGGADVDEVENVPKTVRENPGVYRSHFINYMKYSGGK